MADTKLSWRELTQGSPEMRMDYRLIEKKIEEGFLTREEAEAWLKQIPQEAEFDFSLADELDKED